MLISPIGRRFGSCTIPRTVPNTVANIFAIRANEIAPRKTSLRTTSALLEIYERGVFGRDMVWVDQGR